MMSARTPQVQKYIQAFAEKNVDLIRELYAVDAVLEDPVGSEVKRGIEEICAFYEATFAAGVTLEVSEPERVAGNTIAFVFKVVADGFSISPIDVFELNAEGKITSMKAYWGPENIVA